MVFDLISFVFDGILFYPRFYSVMENVHSIEHSKGGKEFDCSSV